MAKGNMAVFDISGPDNVTLMHSGPSVRDGSQPVTASVSDMTLADEASNTVGAASAEPAESKQANNSNNSSNAAE